MVSARARSLGFPPAGAPAPDSSLQHENSHPVSVFFGDILQVFPGMRNGLENVQTSYKYGLFQNPYQDLKIIKVLAISNKISVRNAGHRKPLGLLNSEVWSWEENSGPEPLTEESWPDRGVRSCGSLGASGL